MTTIPSRSRLPGFYNLSLKERRALLLRGGWLTEEEFNALSGEAGLTAAQADHMIENVVGLHALPLGIALNFLVNDREVLVPMAIEEPSVVAGASYMAKLARAGGGFTAGSDPPLMIRHVQLLDLADLPAAPERVQARVDEILDARAQVDPVIASLGGGARH